MQLTVMNLKITVVFLVVTLTRRAFLVILPTPRLPSPRRTRAPIWLLFRFSGRVPSCCRRLFTSRFLEFWRRIHLSQSVFMVFQLTRAVTRLPMVPGGRVTVRVKLLMKLTYFKKFFRLQTLTLLLLRFGRHGVLPRAVWVVTFIPAAWRWVKWVYWNGIVILGPLVTPFSRSSGPGRVMMIVVLVMALVLLLLLLGARPRSRLMTIRWRKNPCCRCVPGVEKVLLKFSWLSLAELPLSVLDCF